MESTQGGAHAELATKISRYRLCFGRDVAHVLNVPCRHSCRHRLCRRGEMRPEESGRGTQSAGGTTMVQTWPQVTRKKYGFRRLLNGCAPNGIRACLSTQSWSCAMNWTRCCNGSDPSVISTARF